MSERKRKVEIEGVEPRPIESAPALLHHQVQPDRIEVPHFPFPSYIPGRSEETTQPSPSRGRRRAAAHVEGAEVISFYSRAQAIKDEMLKPVPEEVARQFGFRLPLALTQKLWSALTAFQGGDTDAEQVAERMFTILRAARDAAIRGEKESDIQFGCSIPTNAPRYYGPDDATLRMILHGGDEGEAVATLGYANDEW